MCFFLLVDKDVNTRCAYMSLSNRTTKWFLPRSQLSSSVRRSDRRNQTSKIAERFIHWSFLALYIYIMYIVNTKWMTPCICVYASTFLKRLNQINVHIGACSNNKEKCVFRECHGYSQFNVILMLSVHSRWWQNISMLKTIKKTRRIFKIRFFQGYRKCA